MQCTVTYCVQCNVSRVLFTYLLNQESTIKRICSMIKCELQSSYFIYSLQLDVILVFCLVFTARCLQCKARSCDRMSSLCPSDCLSVCDIGGLWSHKLEFFRNNFTISYPGVFIVRSLQTQTSGVYSKGNTWKFWPKVTHPLLIRASGDIRSAMSHLSLASSAL